MQALLNDYKTKFDEQFPLMLCMGMDEKEIEVLIKKCIKKGKPYKPKIDEDVVY